MIDFQGEVSGKCKDFLLQFESKVGKIGGFITAILFSIPTVILSLKVNLWFLLWIPIFIGIAFVAGLPPSKKSYGLILPCFVRIDTESGMVTSRGEKFCYNVPIREVRKVVDMGEWYQIYVQNRNGRFACQKSLISQGSIEEFEKIFADKLVKR